MEMDDSWFPAWWQGEATPEERRLFESARDSEGLFGDMLFQEDASTYDLIKCESKLQDGSWEEDEVPLPDELACFSYSFFHFKVGQIGHATGQFDCGSQTLTVAPGALGDGYTLLHELIHLHEFVINGLPLYFHDMVCWALYQDLKSKLPGLDELVEGHAHLLTGSSIYSKGGLHDILFLLKSLDLDFRKGYHPGTVFGYGRADDFKGYSFVGKRA